MKDLEFANNLYTFRKSEGLGQKDLAKLLGLTNKAISKWETGAGYPTVEQLIKLSKIFNVTLDELVSKTPSKDLIIKKICLTGGPCSGKTTAISWIQTEFRKKGWTTLFIGESATEFILSGAAPWTLNSVIDFQAYLLKHQLNKEKIYEELAQHMFNAKKVLIVCDRGALDTKAYLNEAEFKQVLKRLNTNEVTLRDSYDAVFHLVSSANGAEEFYSSANNNARYETIEEAKEIDQKTLNAWTGHPHLRVIDNSTNFESKMRRLMAEISSFLGEPQPYEIERKFLIELPNIKQLEKLPNCHKTEIIQTYLKSSPDIEIRIRQRGEGENFTYTKTIKQEVSLGKRIETESRITKNEYLKLLIESDPTRHPITKTRYCLMSQGQYFEIDIYPQWKDKAIIEIELTNAEHKIKFPKFINIIKEVTDDKKFFNSNLAKIPTDQIPD